MRPSVAGAQMRRNERAGGRTDGDEPAAPDTAPAPGERPPDPVAPPRDR